MNKIPLSISKAAADNQGSISFQWGVQRLQFLQKVRPYLTEAQNLFKTLPDHNPYNQEIGKLVQMVYDDIRETYEFLEKIKEVAGDPETNIYGEQVQPAPTQQVATQ